jgi:hypothetical protein
MTAAIIFALLSTGQPFEKSIDLPANAKPAYLPAVVGKTAASSGKIILDGWCRGYHPLRWEYVIPMSPDKTRKALLTDYRSVNGAQYAREMQDRSQRVSVVEGRIKTGAHGPEYVDRKTITTLTLSESPLLTGPLPKTWPSAGVSPKPPLAILPLELPSLGSPEPTTVSSGITPGGATQVWVEWMIPFDRAEAERRIDRDIAGGAPWVKKGSQYERTDGRSGWFYVKRIGLKGTGDSALPIWGIWGSYVLPGTDNSVRVRRSPRVK